MQECMPFASKIPSAAPVAIGGMNQAQLDAELLKGIASMRNGKTYTADEIDAQFTEEFGE